MPLNVQRRAPKTVASAKIFGSCRQRRPIQICMAYYMQLLIYSCNYSFYIFIYVFKLIVLFLILVWRQITALRACLRNRRHTLRDEDLAIPLGGKCDPPPNLWALTGSTRLLFPWILEHSFLMGCSRKAPNHT